MPMNKYATWGFLPGAPIGQNGIGTRIGSLRGDSSVSTAIIDGFKQLDLRAAQAAAGLVAGFTELKTELEEGLADIKAEVGSAAEVLETQMEESTDSIVEALEDGDPGEVPTPSTDAMEIVVALGPLWSLLSIWSRHTQNQLDKALNAVDKRLGVDPLATELHDAGLTDALGELFASFKSAGVDDAHALALQLQAFHLDVLREVD